MDATISEENAVNVTSVQQVLPMRVQGKLYAIDLSFVECVLPLMELQHVSGRMPYITGLMDYRGNNLAVIDLGVWLGLDATESYYNLDTPIIVCGNGQTQVAFVVNEVMQVEMVKPETVQTNSIEESDSPFKASLNLSSGAALLLDMKRLLRVNFY